MYRGTSKQRLDFEPVGANWNGGGFIIRKTTGSGVLEFLS